MVGLNANTVIADVLVGDQEDFGPEIPADRQHGHSTLWHSKASLEDYMHFAALQRERERLGVDYRAEALEYAAQHGETLALKSEFKGRHLIFRGAKHRRQDGHLAPAADDGDTMVGRASSLDNNEKNNKKGEKPANENAAAEVNVHDVNRSDELAGLPEWEGERLNARRALRYAGYISAFFLITADVFGLYGIPYSYSTIGYGPATALFVVYGLVAMYCGVWLMWTYGKLDSIRFPIQTYGDMGGRLIGSWFQVLINVLQAIQLLINTSTLVLNNGENLELIVRGSSGTGGICFLVAVVIFAIVGMVVGQIRTLNRIAWLSNANIWLTLVGAFIIMGFVAHQSPNIQTAIAGGFVQPDGSAEPVMTYGRITGDLPTQINGVFNMIFSWGGATIFPEIMSEMRKPMDFWRGMLIAQVFIMSFYLLFGIFVYHFTGQYTPGLAYQGLNSYVGTVITNVIALITNTMTAVLYANVGLKVVYITIGEKFLHFPHFLSKKGWIVWGLSVIVFWALAFVIGVAIPQVQTIAGLIAAIATGNFSYTFPLLLSVAAMMHISAMQGDGEYSEGDGKTKRVDTWRNWSRWRRAIFGQYKWFILLNFIGFLAGLAQSGLGMYGTGEAIKETFENSPANSFSCISPV